MLNVNTGIDDLDDCLLVMSMSVSTQCKVVCRASIIVAVNGIWRVRNQARFQNKNILWRTTCSFIYAYSQLAGNSFNGSFSLDMSDFQVLKEVLYFHQPTKT